MLKFFGGLWGAGLGLLLCACGGSDEGSDGSCEEAATCGGNLVGSWKVTSTCLTIDTSTMPSMGCEGSSYEAGDVSATGNVTYRADQTYSASLTMMGNIVATLPASCLMQQGITLTCGQVQEALRQQSSATTDFGSTTCSGASGGGCVCTVPFIPMTNDADGTYTTSGGTLTQTETGGSPDDSNYCVKGNTLTLSPTASNMSGASGTIVLTKQ